MRNFSKNQIKALKISLSAFLLSVLVFNFSFFGSFSENHAIDFSLLNQKATAWFGSEYDDDERTALAGQVCFDNHRKVVGNHTVCINVTRSSSCDYSQTTDCPPIALFFKNIVAKFS